LPPSGQRGLTESLEDYLKAIYSICRDRGVARVKEIAEVLGVKPSSVTFSLKRLAEMGLVEYEKRGYVSLTEEGMRIVAKLSLRYRSLRFLLERVLGVPSDIAEEDACGMEHHLHDETIARIEKFVEFVEKSEEGSRLIAKFREYCSRSSGGARHVTPRE